MKFRDHRSYWMSVPQNDRYALFLSADRKTWEVIDLETGEVRGGIGDATKEPTGFSGAAEDNEYWLIENAAKESTSFRCFSLPEGEELRSFSVDLGARRTTFHGASNDGSRVVLSVELRDKFVVSVVDTRKEAIAFQWDVPKERLLVAGVDVEASSMLSFSGEGETLQEFNLLTGTKRDTKIAVPGRVNLLRFLSRELLAVALDRSVSLLAHLELGKIVFHSKQHTLHPNWLHRVPMVSPVQRQVLVSASKEHKVLRDAPLFEAYILGLDGTILERMEVPVRDESNWAITWTSDGKLISISTAMQSIARVKLFSSTKDQGTVLHEVALPTGLSTVPWIRISPRGSWIFIDADAGYQSSKFSRTFWFRYEP